MKLFARRKKAAATTDSTPKERIFQSDEKVAELLKKDPSSWNAKERRMVKRFRDRKSPDADSPENTGPSDKEPASIPDISTSHRSSDTEFSPKTPAENSVARESDIGSSDDSSSSDENESKDGSSNEPVGVKVKDVPKTSKCAPVVEGTASPDDDKNPDPKNPTESADPELQKVLEKINSKQRRKISRKLERGEVSLQTAITEARAVLDDGKPMASETKAEETPQGATNSKTRKKGRKPVDWSTLPPEERLRREEQRRKQQEAAERREKFGASKTHAHPLNSERRRANRRKRRLHNAAHQRGDAGQEGTLNEHDYSGYHMRKVQKMEKTAAN